MKESAARTLDQVGESLRSRARRYQAACGPHRGRYPDEFKREIVALLRAGIDSGEMASRIEIPQITIQSWQARVNLERGDRPPCRPLRVVEDAPAAAISVAQDAVASNTSPSCVIRLPGGIEIALGSQDVDERLLRVVMGVVP